MHTKDKVQYVYEKLKILSEESYKKGNLENTLKYIETAARVAYIFNIFFMDEAIENKLHTLSKQIIINQNDFTPIKCRFLFYDSFGLSNRGLVHQYIRSLISWGVEFLYVCGSNNENRTRILLQEISNYSKAEIFIVNDSLLKTEQIKIVYKIISEYRPENAFLYLSPWDVVAITTFCAMPEIIKHLVNLTDHAFWLGSSCINYSIEFRNYGCTISQQKRNISKEKLLLQPFYPIVIPMEFKGFPKEVTPDKTVIFSGGAYYKIYGDNEKFFYIVKRILDENPNVIILFAGAGDDRHIKQFIEENQLENRFILLGFRSDINELFAHCDIYLGTYPTSGGLMSQYAAINGKPILAYTSSWNTGNYVEEILFHRNLQKDFILTHIDLETFFKEAKKLIDDKVYREKIGQSLRDCIIIQEQFDSELYQLVTTHTNIRKIEEVVVDYKKLAEQYLEIENKYQDSLEIILFSKLKFYALWLFPSIVLKFIPTLIFRYKKLIIKKILN